MKKNINIHDPHVQSIALAALFFLLAGSVVFFHEPWRDEAQSWLLARDASLFQLIHLAKYEGSFILWHLVLMPFAKLGFPYETQSMISLVIGTATAYLVARFAPFSLLQKMLLLGGYYFFYEYTIIARSYGLTVLLAILVLVLYHVRTVRYGAYTLVRVLLSMTNIFGFIFSVVFSIFGWFVNRRLRLINKKKIVFGELCYLAALLPQAFLLIPPPDLAVRITKNILSPAMSLWDVLHILNGAFIPIPPPIIQFWGKVYVDGSLLFFSFGLFVFFALIRWGLPLMRARLFFLVFSLVTLGIIERLELAGSMRHLGMIFIGYVVAFWIQQAAQPSQTKTSTSLLAPRILFSSLLIIHMFASIPAIAYEVTLPFSSGRTAARAIRATRAYNAQSTIISAESALTESIRPYLAQPFYCLEYEQVCSYMIWDKRFESWHADIQTYGWTDNALARLSSARTRATPSLSIMLISPIPLPAHIPPKQWKLLTFIPAGIISDERFFIYEHVQK